MAPSLYTHFARAAFATSLIGITVLSLVPIEGGLAINIWDKAQHSGAYIYLTLLLCAAANPHRITPRHMGMLMAYGIAIEVAQATLPWRSFSFLDMLANASGIALGTLIVLLASALKKTLSKPVTH